MGHPMLNAINPRPRSELEQKGGDLEGPTQYPHVCHTENTSCEAVLETLPAPTLTTMPSKLPFLSKKTTAMTQGITIIHLVSVKIIPRPVWYRWGCHTQNPEQPSPQEGGKTVLVNCDFFGVLLDFIFNLLT